MGVSYDIEQSSPSSGDRTALWAVLKQKILAFNASSAAARAAADGAWLGFSFIRPAIWDFSGDAAMLHGARSLDDQVYFNTLRGDWAEPDGDINGTNGIADQIAFCAQPGAGCKVTVGWETSAEDGGCKTFYGCKTSFVWGGGLPNGTALADWVEATFEPTLRSKFGIDPVRDFADPPYFIEHHASYMAYLNNVKTGMLPASSCFRGECTTCCPAQKHRTFCQ